jgi:hypothetical protein
MKLETKQTKTVEPGRHNGTIMEVKDRTHGDYKYVDIGILVDDTEITLKLSAPANVSVKQDGTPASKLAVILNKLGVALEGEVELEDVVKKRVQFITTEEVTDNGTFAVIDHKSLKLEE